MVMKVVVPNIRANEGIDMVRELRAKGLVQGRDFDFSYQPPTYDIMGFNMLTPHSVEFSFTDSKWATFFRLKYDGAN
jgi:hypothetical protein